MVYFFLTLPVGATHRLSGYKWFASVADAEVTLTLARVEGQSTLSCFGVFVSEQQPNSVRPVQLKNKMGTRQLPTAELELTDCYATLLGKEGDGIRVISSQLNITRLHNGVAATGFIGRALMLAKNSVSYSI